MVKLNILHFKNLLPKRPASETGRIKRRAYYFSQIYVNCPTNDGSFNANNGSFLFHALDKKQYTHSRSIWMYENVLKRTFCNDNPSPAGKLTAENASLHSHNRPEVGLL